MIGGTSSGVEERLIYEFLQYRRAPAGHTPDLAAKPHNRILCPAVQRKCEQILGTLEHYQTIAYDIQGPRDEGADVVLRLAPTGEQRFVLFQIKSGSELRGREVLTTLKAQWYAATHRYAPLADYYILLCCDAIAAKERVRAIEATFATSERTHIIEPEYVLTFLRLTSLQIDALTTMKLGVGDVVLGAARAALADLTPTELAVLLQLVWREIRDPRRPMAVSELARAGFVRDVYDRTPDYDREWFTHESELHEWGDEEDDFVDDDEIHFRLRNLAFEERLAFDLDQLENSFVEHDQSGHVLLSDRRSLRPLMAVVLDGAVRYGYETRDLLEYALTVLGPRKGLDEPSDAPGAFDAEL